MSLVTTGTNALKVAKPKYLYATPYSNATTKGDTTYRFDHILRDSISLTQDDNEVNEVENELTDDNIIEIVTLGKFQFEATVEDMQTDLVKDLCGYTASTDGAMAFAPSAYSERYAEIVVVFDNPNESGKYIGFVLPKVLLNTGIIMESLSSSMVGFSLAGTAYSASVANGEDTITTPFYMNTDYTLPTNTAA